MLFGPANTAIASARKRPSLISTNFPYFSIKFYLILGLILATYPQASSAAAAPRKEEAQEDVLRSQRTHDHSSNLDLLQPLIMRRNDLTKLARRAVPLGGAGGYNQFGGYNPAPAGNNYDPDPVPEGNGNNYNNVLTTPHVDTPSVLTTKLSSIVQIFDSMTSSLLPQAPSTSPVASPLTPTTPIPNGASSSQSSELGSIIATESSGNGTSTSWGFTALLPTGQVAPDQPHNTSHDIPGYTMTFSAGQGAGAGGNYQQRVDRGLVIGLAISLVLLVASCGLAAFLMVRRLRRNQQKQQASPYSDTAPWIPSPETGLIEKAETEGSVDSHTSDLQSIASTPRQRARTPGGSSAIPIPYNPSEVSDDVSAHFTFFPRDEAIGVPVPYPLALHIPARVAQAIAERDARWQLSDDLQRQAYLHGRSSSNASGRTQDELLTIPDRGSRRSTRRSTSESMMSSSEGVYYTIARRLSTPHSDSAPSRSDIGMDGHIVEGPDGHSTHGSNTPDQLASAGEIPIPPPLATRTHGAQSSTRLLRRVSAALPPGSALYSPRLLSVSENPFATAASLERTSEDGTTTPYSDDSRRLSSSSAVGGVAERVALRPNLARRTLLRQSIVRSPFDDERAHEDTQSDRRASNSTTGTERRSARESEVYAGVVEHQTVDGHDPTIFVFPAPPKPTRRPS